MKKNTRKKSKSVAADAGMTVRWFFVAGENDQGSLLTLSEYREAFINSFYPRNASQKTRERAADKQIAALTLEEGYVEASEAFAVAKKLAEETQKRIEVETLLKKIINPEREAFLEAVRDGKTSQPYIVDEAWSAAVKYFQSK